MHITTLQELKQKASMSELALIEKVETLIGPDIQERLQNLTLKRLDKIKHKVADALRRDGLVQASLVSEILAAIAPKSNETPPEPDPLLHS